MYQIGKNEVILDPISGYLKIEVRVEGSLFRCHASVCVQLSVHAHLYLDLSTTSLCVYTMSLRFATSISTFCLFLLHYLCVHVYSVVYVSTYEHT